MTTEPETTTPARILDEARSLPEAVFQALGAATVAWENPGGAGVFDSTRAKAIGDELLEGIRAGRWREESRLRAVDDDPEFWHGLTLLGDRLSAQIRDAHIVLLDRTRGSELEVPADEARRLRDLLNLATARGAL